jgi:hypothetical protein
MRIVPAFLQATPVVSASVFVFVYTREWTALALGVLGALLLFGISKCILLSFVAENAESAGRALNRLAEKYTLRSFAPSEFIPGHTGSAGEKPSGGGPRETKESAIVVVAQPKDDDAPLLTTFKAYSLCGFAPSLIVVGSPPGDGGSGQLFFLLHELAHGSLVGASHSLQRRQALLRVWALYFPFLGLIDPKAGPIGPIALLLLAIWHYIIETRFHFAEMAADLSAAKQLLRIVGPARTTATLRTLLKLYEGRVGDPGKRGSVARTRVRGLRRATNSQSIARWFETRERDTLMDEIVKSARIGPVAAAFCLTLSFPSAPKTSFLVLVAVNVVLALLRVPRLIRGATMNAGWAWWVTEHMSGNGSRHQGGAGTA